MKYSRNHGSERGAHRSIARFGHAGVWSLLLAACGGSDTTSGTGALTDATMDQSTEGGASATTAGGRDGASATSTTGGRSTGSTSATGSTGATSSTGATGGDAGNTGSTGASSTTGATSGLDGALDGDGASSDPTGPICRAVAAAACSPGQTFAACENMFRPYVACPRAQQCIACAGATPVVVCADTGDPDLVGCEAACDHVMTTCTDGDASADAGTGGGTGTNGGTGSGDAGTGAADAGTGAGDGASREAGLDGGAAICPDARLVTAVGGGDSSQPPSQIVPTSGNDLVIFGPAMGSGFGEPGGAFVLTGYPPNATIAVQVVMAPACNVVGCPMDIVFDFADGDGGSVGGVGSTDAGCGSTVVHADASGELVIHVGKVGGSGAEGNVGVLLRVTALDAGAPVEASSADGGQTDASSGTDGAQGDATGSNDAPSEASGNDAQPDAGGSADAPTE